MPFPEPVTTARVRMGISSSSSPTPEAGGRGKCILGTWLGHSMGRSWRSQMQRSNYNWGQSEIASRKAGALFCRQPGDPAGF